VEIEHCPVPEDRLYDFEESSWVQREERSGLWTLGLTSWFVSFVGRFQSVSYRPIDGPQAAGRSVATLESLRFTGAVRLPLGGTVVERNPELPTRPRLLNDDPYGEGWVVRFRPDPPATSSPRLEPAAAIADRLLARVRALRIQCWPASPDLELVEVGTECAATLARLDDELAARAAGEVVLLVTDDPTSPLELVRWSDRTGHALLMHRADDGLHRFLLRKEAHPVPRTRDLRTGRVGGR
jgi:glycine cleavage system H protein